jgi:prophage tail gpP-like protein
MSRIIVENATSGRELLWRHIKIKKSLGDICHTLELEIPASERAKVHKHEKIEVRYENDLVKDSGGRRRVTTVRVDEITAGADVSKHSVLVIGRSPARDIIDSTWSDLLINMTLYEVTKNICDKFGIVCTNIPTDRGDPTAKVAIFSWENESPWTKLITEADSQKVDGRGFMLTSNEAGDLYIWQVPPENAVRREGFHLTEGRNIKTIEWKENGAEQYHEYIVTGGYGDPVNVIDNTCNNNRVLTINLTNPEVEAEKILRRAQTEMCRRRENRTTVTVSGWGLTDTQIKNLGETIGTEIFWVPNLLIPVSMPSLGLQANLLIAEVEQEADTKTMSSTITLVNREAYL